MKAAKIVDKRRALRFKLVLLSTVMELKRVYSSKPIKKRLWVHPIFQRRKTRGGRDGCNVSAISVFGISKLTYSGQFHRLAKELRLERESSYLEYFRMNPQTYDSLLNIIQPRILKQNTCMREAISPSERLAVTLR